MPKVNVRVRWTCNNYDLSVELDDPVEYLRIQLFSLTQVPPEKQTILSKGTKLVDKNFNDFKLLLKESCSLMLIGEACKDVGDISTSLDLQTNHPQPVQVTFLEDLTEHEQSTLGQIDLPPGLANLDNTCYLNAAIQLLYAIPELRLALCNYQGSPNDADHRISITSSLRDLFQIIATSKETVMPILFLAKLRQHFPQFDEMQYGRHRQQSTDEAWIQILSCLKVLPKFSTIDQLNQEEKEEGDGAISQLVEGSCIRENNFLDAQGKVLRVLSVKEVFSTLSCNIEWKVDFLLQGIQLHLDQIPRSKIGGNLTSSSNDGNNGEDGEGRLSTISRISQLPLYFHIQLLRFFWNTSANEGAGAKSKICRPVEIPFELDVYNLCTEDLQNRLNPIREQTQSSTDSLSIDHLEPGNVVINGPINGWYDLAGIITHRGRDIESGHYVSWIKQDQTWFCFDDNKVTKVELDEIKKLSGKNSVNWHLAYICMYKARRIKLDPNHHN